VGYRVEGDGEGNCVGDMVGQAVGLLVGGSVGYQVGFAVGRSVGRLVGKTVGFSVGAAVGEWEGNGVGFEVGTKEGYFVGNTVGETEGVHVVVVGLRLVLGAAVEGAWLGTLLAAPTISPFNRVGAGDGARVSGEDWAANDPLDEPPLGDDALIPTAVPNKISSSISSTDRRREVDQDFLAAPS